MDVIQSAFVPILALWTVFDNLLKAAQMVNNLREVIVSGKLAGSDLTLEHRRAMFFDWVLLMSGAVLVAFVSAAVVYWIAPVLVKPERASTVIETVAKLVALFPFLGGLMFILCGISDARLIARTLNRVSALSVPQNAGAAAST